MSIWEIVLVWVASSFAFAVVYGLGAAIGYRRGWEEHRAAVDGGAAADQLSEFDPVGVEGR